MANIVRTGLAPKKVMDITDSQYCKTTKTLMKIYGLWSYQNSKERKIRIVLSSIVVGGTLFLEFLKVIRDFQEINLFEAIPTLITTFICLVKLNIMNWNKERLYNLTNEIDKDWREQTVSDEIEIIINYMSKGRLYTIVYTGFLYLILLVYFSALLFPYVLNIVSPLNETRSLNYIYPAEYFINEEENFVWILTIETISCYFGIGILLAHDTMLILYVQYICAMFAIVGHRLEHTLYKLHDENYLCVARKKRMYTEFVGSCVQTHRKALYFVDLLESCFMLSQLIILSLNVVCLAVTLASISTLAGSIDSLRFILYASGQLLHIFYVSYQSEKLISHSLTVSKSVYNGTWYNIPQEVQKMLLFILRRANIPSYLTAGKIVVFSIQTFSVVVQNSMSYFMVLTSLN